MTLEEMFDFLCENVNSASVVYLPDSGIADEEFFEEFVRHQNTMDDASCITLIPCTKTACTGRALAEYAQTTAKNSLFVVYYDKLYGVMPRIRDDQFDPYEIDGVFKSFVYHDKERKVISWPNA
ncbi:hypothetical protein [Vibrio phage BONAISHI]|nr:hypothetical protein [Vibrio phage BONAISHI]